MKPLYSIRGANTGGDLPGSFGGPGALLSGNLFCAMVAERTSVVATEGDGKTGRKFGAA